MLNLFGPRVVGATSRAARCAQGRLASSSQPSSSSSTISTSEIDFFDRLAAEWWNEQGELGLLHRMNRARVQFVREQARAAATAQCDGPAPLAGAKVLDVGCGGGIFSEASAEKLASSPVQTLARLGARVTAIDASSQNVAVARRHASADPRLDALHYEHVSAEDLAERGEQFEWVCSMEVLEHVDNPRVFLDALARLTTACRTAFSSDGCSPAATWCFRPSLVRLWPSC